MSLNSVKLLCDRDTHNLMVGSTLGSHIPRFIVMVFLHKWTKSSKNWVGPRNKGMIFPEYHQNTMYM